MNFRNLCDKAVPGNKVTVTGIYSIKRAAKVKGDRGGPKVNFGKIIIQIRIVKLLYYPFRFETQCCKPSTLYWTKNFFCLNYGHLPPETLS